MKMRVLRLRKIVAIEQIVTSNFRYKNDCNLTFSIWTGQCFEYEVKKPDKDYCTCQGVCVLKIVKNK